MTTPSTLLLVRLDQALAKALERHCAQTGASRSEVVKKSVAQYLVAQTSPTLGSLAESLLPRLPKRGAGTLRAPRQERFRDYLREKRLRRLGIPASIGWATHPAPACWK